MTACARTPITRRTGSVSGWIMVSVLLVIPSGCGEKPKPQPPPPPKVTVAQPVYRTVTDYLELTGNTQAIYTVQLVARVAGYLEQVLFRDGQIVKRPAPLHHPAEHVRGHPPASRSQHLAVPGAVRVCRSPVESLFELDPAQRGHPVGRRQLALSAGHGPGQPPLGRGAARSGEAQSRLHAGRGPVRRAHGSEAGRSWQRGRVRRKHRLGPDQPDQPDLCLFQHQRSRSGPPPQAHGRDPRAFGCPEMAGARRPAR